ncbi:MAG: transcriptional regulator [Microcoleus sp. PH2017_10_PVI_O_A]|uniref:GspH/FimT family pseudopilin n=1 Tax=unclassified Microcoleus TaxID=2642155 RepID=UPI001DEBBFF4|nr:MULTISPECIES: GspH/FimT family pseudopilin [unclassified Microcoleus]TAE82477.1 MAG: transcriptional regulator [Oscillatoriales cyanobacterium]MCC3406168.1 transcriptional regulator [Microcoleus sp. PH2017_10_PVI_O_A]MCC3460759.1 transcriptional regulator [Microcoleus sp. PH2017_11_PCY_U_A]MCC3479321.1 transcriptional regulator [Microcoleus sp. PH2017_12_PCY_D_A]MCC3560162.1 transcriptional regulator [Microcoleus sp. PH2017_27_LUM_O_A]
MKTPQILLKLLQKSAAKARPNFNNTASSKGEVGYTIIELLIIVLILGIFASIAAPGWLGFINRQRVRTVNDRVLQTLRTAQSEAKRTKRDVTVIFDTSDPSKVTFNPAIATGGSTQQLNGGGEIKPGQIQLAVIGGDTPAPVLTPPLTATQKSLTFKFDGAFDPNSKPTLPFIVTISSVNGGTNQCVIVQTLLGGMRTDEGTGCQ